MKSVPKWLSLSLSAAITASLLTGCTSGSRLLSDAQKLIRDPFEVSADADSSAPDDGSGADVTEVDAGVTAGSENDAFSLFGFPVDEAEGLTGYAYEQLAEGTRSVYAQLYTGISEKMDSFTIRAKDTDAIKAALTAVIADHPEFFWINGSAAISGFSAFGIWQIRPEFTVESSRIEEIEDRIEECANEYLSSLDADATEYGKVKAAYEYIIRSTDYSLESPQNQNIQSVFIDHLSVCAGYARAFQYLLHKAGVFCAYVEGETDGSDAESHAWNLVRIDGVYTFVDPSWGDPTYREDETDAAILPIIYDYLCLTSEEMLRTGHIPDSAYYLPDCSDRQYDYYRLNGLYYEGFDPDAISGALWHAVDEGEQQVFMKFSDDDSYLAAQEALFPPEGSGIESLLSGPIRQRMEWDEISSMRYYFSCSDELRIIKIYW